MIFSKKFTATLGILYEHCIVINSKEPKTPPHAYFVEHLEVSATTEIYNFFLPLNGCTSNDVKEIQIPTTRLNVDKRIKKKNMHVFTYSLGRIPYFWEKLNSSLAKYTWLVRVQSPHSILRSFTNKFIGVNILCSSLLATYIDLSESIDPVRWTMFEAQNLKSHINCTNKSKQMKLISFL